MTEQQTAIPQQNKPKGRLKKVVLWFLGIIAGLFLVLVLAGMLLEAKIKGKIIAEINESVTVPVEVKGGIDLSLIRHFPYASLTFKDVSIDDKLQKGKKLLKVKEFSLLCNIYSLFGDKIEFSKVVVRDGDISLYKNESGKSNFDILKPGSDTAKAKLSIAIKKAEIKRVKFSFVDRGQSTEIFAQLKKALLSGNFDENIFELDVETQVHIDRLKTGAQDFLADKDVNAEVKFTVDKLKKRYDFKDGSIAIDESRFDINGYIAQQKNGTQLNFKLVNEGKDMAKLIALLPANFKNSLEQAEGSGEYAIEATINGVLSRNSTPKVSLTASVKNSELKLGKYNKLLKDVNAAARYEMDEYGNDKIVVSNFNCTLNAQPFNFKLTIDKLKDPSFDFFANGVLMLEELSPFVPDTVMQDIGGSITFSNFHLKGRKSDFTDVENSTLSGGGQFKLNEVEFRNNGITYGNIGGVLKYENHLIEAQNFTLNFLSTDFNFSGTIDNLFAFAYNLSQKRQANGVVLGVNGKVKVNTFNLSGIMEAFDKKNKPAAQQRAKINVREVLSMQGNLDVEIGRFIYRKMEFKDLHTNLQVAPGIIQFNNLSARAMAGEVRTNGRISFTPENTLSLRCDIRLADMDVPTIFAQCENFGQTTLTDKHLKGKLTSAINLNISWLNYKDLDENGLSAIVDFSIRDGELVKFEPLRAASKFIRVEELEDIKFSELANTIKIENRRIDIPEFEIKTSALNLMFYGYHYFDNNVDYHFKINLHKLLAQKFRRTTNDLQFMEDDPYEGLNIYLSMSGKLSDPQIKLDKASTRNRIKEDFKKEKDVLKNLLNNTPTPVDEKEKKREEKYFDVKEQPQFIDFDESNQ
ncbi:MAG: AsmA-like C-terminal region-containing protein [Chitinophagales bacterium]